LKLYGNRLKALMHYFAINASHSKYINRSNLW